ncbi:MAG TPA: hypothetical protein PLJ60_04135 [Chryseolinea sp.]|nr:hypothetical protein [Chryseolinea sp.]HPM29506.1 hypothetical protein [Chryseolinea sp.]
MRLLFIFLIITFSFSSFAQQPSILEPLRISDGGVFGFTLSNDGKEAFWVKSYGGRDTLIIMRSYKRDEVWQKPAPASFSGHAGVWKDIDPVFSPDNTIILFQSNRPVEGKPDRKGFDIWAVKKTKTGWSEAYHLGDSINTDASESFASMTNNGNIYFMKENPNGIGSSDIYVSKYVNKQYKTPVNIGAPINTSFRESNPYISPKEDYIIYFSSDSTGLGEVDLFISFRKKDQWSKPKSLGAPINSAIGEFCPFVHQKQKRLYFSRTEQRPGGRRVEDIYSFPFDVEKYR